MGANSVGHRRRCNHCLRRRSLAAALCPDSHVRAVRLVSSRSGRTDPCISRFQGVKPFQSSPPLTASRRRKLARWLPSLLLSVFLPVSGNRAVSAAESLNRIVTMAGNGVAGYTGDKGPATNAQVANPYGLIRGPDGAVYVCEVDNHVIRRIDRSGIISTVAGNGLRGYSGDGGPALRAQLNEPYEVRFDKANNMVFVEMKNHLVRRVDAKTGS